MATYCVEVVLLCCVATFWSASKAAESKSHMTDNLPKKDVLDKQECDKKTVSGDDCGVPDLLSDNDEENSEDDFNKWDDEEGDDWEEEINMLAGDVACLFCALHEHSVESLLSHCKQEHNFDLINHCKGCSMDCISYIKMINYIRTKRPSVETVKDDLSRYGALWSSDDYMKASDPEDLMLQYDIESAQDDLKQDIKQDLSNHNDSSDQKQHKSESISSNSEAIFALIDSLRKTEAQRDLLKEELDRALGDIHRLKLIGQQIVMESDDMRHKERHADVRDYSSNADDGYFESYSHYDIHMKMLKDRIRTESYRDFIQKNHLLFEGKLVLDVGCGTGILSMFAAKAGAKHVVAVDQSTVIYNAIDIARVNNLHDKITFVKGKLEEVRLPFEKFDIIISEWMGYFLLYECMIETIIWARDHYLLPGGYVYPDHFSMYIVGVSDPGLRKSDIEFWDDVYGFNMSSMKRPVIEEVHIKSVTKESVVTNPALIKDIDMMKVTDFEFSAAFSLACLADAEITAIAGYFDTDFSAGCHTKISFSTGPHAAATHWDQTVMFLPTPIVVKKDSHLDGRITLRKNPQDSRGILIDLQIGNQRMKYSLAD